jgi:short-subunit dehydrogenase
MKTILITGASGFLGQSLCDHYVKLGYKVVGVSRNNKNLFNVKLKN